MKEGNAPFQVDIILDQSPVQAGSTLTGRLVLPNEALSEKAAIKSIKILFEGQEKTQVMYQEASSSDHERYSATVKEKCGICSQILVENAYDKSQVARQTTPFQYSLPSNLPASVTLGHPNFEYGLIFKKKADYAILSYKIKVEIQRHSLFKGTLKYNQIVQVVQRPDRLAIVGAPWEVVPTIKTPKRTFFGRGPRKIYIAARLSNGTHVEVEQNSSGCIRCKHFQVSNRKSDCIN